MSHSQNTLNKERVNILVNNGDTLIVFTYDDAKIILSDLLQCEYTDSLLITYVERDSINTNIIRIQKKELDTYFNKVTNLLEITNKLKELESNKDKTIIILEEENKELNKRVKKEKRKQKLTMIGSGILILLILILGN